MTVFTRFNYTENTHPLRAPSRSSPSQPGFAAHISLPALPVPWLAWAVKSGDGMRTVERPKKMIGGFETRKENTVERHFLFLHIMFGGRLYNGEKRLYS